MFQVSFLNFIVCTFTIQDQADGAVKHPHRDRLEYIFHVEVSVSFFQFQCCHAHVSLTAGHAHAPEALLEVLPGLQGKPIH